MSYLGLLKGISWFCMYDLDYMGGSLVVHELSEPVMWKGIKMSAYRRSKSWYLDGSYTLNERCSKSIRSIFNNLLKQVVRYHYIFFTIR